VVANGRQEVLSIKIDPEVIHPEEAEMLQDLILAAVNDALSRPKAWSMRRWANSPKGSTFPTSPDSFRAGP